MDHEVEYNTVLHDVASQKKLTNYGFYTVVCSFDLWQSAIQLFNPHIVVLNHLHGNRNKLIADHVKRQGGSVVVVPNEGRPNSSVIDNWFNEQLDNPNLDLYCAWNNLIDHPKVIDTGCPRFDIYESDILRDTREEFCAKYGLNSSHKIIGITSSFPQAKFSYTHVEFNKNDWDDLNITSIDGREDSFGFAQSEYRNQQKFHLWIRQLIDAYPDYQYIWKPHPMEDIGAIDAYADELGIRIIRQDFIFNFLRACDVLVARIGCVTVQEAWLSNVPTIQLGLSSDERSGASEEAYEIGCHADTAKQLLAVFPYVDDPGPRTIENAYQYLNKYGYLTIDAAGEVTIAINNEVEINLAMSNPTTRQLSKLNKLIWEHSQANYVPNLNTMHLGKSVVQQDVWEWSARL